MKTIIAWWRNPYQRPALIFIACSTANLIVTLWLFWLLAQRIP